MSKSSPVLRISEVYGLVVQGEGPAIGRPTVFVRTGGCDYTCKWCDTLHAVLPQFRHEWKPMPTGAVFDAVRALSGPCLVTLSGGNPAIQPFADLIEIGQVQGYTFTCETQGSVPAPWLGQLDHLVLSPKPPSSGMDTDWDKLDHCVDIGVVGNADVALKVVVFDDADYEYAKSVHYRYPEFPFFLQVGNAEPPPAVDGDANGPGIDVAANLGRLRWLMDRVCADRWHAARVLPQLHLLAFGNERGR